MALTADEAELIAEYCPQARDRVRVIGNGIDDTPLARKSARKRRPAETATILYTGRFVDRKGIRELLEASPKILEHAPGHAWLWQEVTGTPAPRRWQPVGCPNRVIPFATALTSQDGLLRNSWPKGMPTPTFLWFRAGTSHSAW